MSSKMILFIFYTLYFCKQARGIVGIVKVGTTEVPKSPFFASKRQKLAQSKRRIIFSRNFFGLSQPTN
jgi:hypothetical protein